MKIVLQNVSRIEKALRDTYRARETRAAIGVQETRWEEGIMRRIRTIGPLTDSQDVFSIFETFVWRLAPAAMVLLVATGAWALQIDLTTEIETAALMDPIGFDFIHKLGIM